MSKKKYAISVQQLQQRHTTVSKRNCCNLFSIPFRTVGIEPSYEHKVTQLSKAASTAAVMYYNHNATTLWRQPLYNMLKFFVARCSLIISGEHSEWYLPHQPDKWRQFFFLERNYLTSFFFCSKSKLQLTPHNSFVSDAPSLYVWHLDQCIFGSIHLSPSCMQSAVGNWHDRNSWWTTELFWFRIPILVDDYSFTWPNKHAESHLDVHFIQITKSLQILSNMFPNLYKFTCPLFSDALDNKWSNDRIQFHSLLNFNLNGNRT